MTRRRQNLGRASTIATSVGVVTMLARDRYIVSRTVPCPDCRVDVGDGCHDLAGRPMKGPHRVRRRMAIRLLNEAL